MRMFEIKTDEKKTPPPRRQPANTTKNTTLTKYEDCSKIQGGPVEYRITSSEEYDLENVC